MFDQFSEPPATHHVNPEFAACELDFREMTALSEAYRRWAIHGQDYSDESRTDLMLWSADIEAIATWVGRDWIAGFSSYPMSITKWLARTVIRDYALSEFGDRQHAGPR
ncbi:MAG: hypothetical protein OEM91_14270 [Hyphomicrobiales bacterium]|nr:hypothetical protein [Hyphomicrobiales bacterium]